MRSRTGVLTATALGALAVALALGLTRASTRATPRSSAGRPAAPGPSPSPPSPASPDPHLLRDVFHFVDEAVPRRPPEPSLLPPGRSAVAASPAPPAGPRLVGLLRRSGVLVAALSLDGEVELAGPGQSAAGVTVLSVGEDGVRVRRSDGSEDTLTLPD